MADLEDSAIRHMNDDHTEACQRLAHRLGGAGSGWTMTAIDTDGAHLTNGTQVLRLAFDSPVSTAAELRQTLARLSAPA
jgi:hypothetical protein